MKSVQLNALGHEYVLDKIDTNNLATYSCNRCESIKTAKLELDDENKVQIDSDSKVTDVSIGDNNDLLSNALINTVAESLNGTNETISEETAKSVSDAIEDNKTIGTQIVVSSSVVVTSFAVVSYIH